MNIKSLIIFVIAVLCVLSPSYAQTFSYPNGDTTSLAAGPSALANQTGTGIGNIGIGQGVFQYLTIGVGNEGLNTGLGYGCGTGSPSVPFIGAGNTCMGAYALHNIQGPAFHNTGIGAFSLYFTTTGSNITATGEGSGNHITTGNNITIDGFGVGANVCQTGSDDILIGVNGAVDCASSDESHSIHIGGGAGDWIHVTGIDTPSTEITAMNGVLNVTGNISANGGAHPWTPVDLSGAGLTFNVQTATYQKIGNMVFVQLYMLWPSTANTNTIYIGGLPYPVASYGTGAILTSINKFPVARFNAGTSSLNILTINGGDPITNANLSTAYVIFSGWYFTP